VVKLVWRVKPVAEVRLGVVTETEVGRIERDEEASLGGLGLQLAERKQLSAALQAEIVPAQVSVLGERCRFCVACGGMLATKGYYPATFRSLFGDVPIQVRRLLTCRCQGESEVKSFGILDLDHDAVAPESAYVTSRYAALLPFGKVAVLLSDCGRSAVRSMRARSATGRGEWARRSCANRPLRWRSRPKTQPAGSVGVGLDGGHVRSCHRQADRHSR
jgi:hypothetical protein